MRKVIYECIGAFDFLVLRVDSSLKVRGGVRKKRKNEMYSSV